MWSGGPAPQCWPVSTAGSTLDRLGSIRATGGTREGRARLLGFRPGGLHTKEGAHLMMRAFKASWKVRLG
jgi:hypothetical protein